MRLSQGKIISIVYLKVLGDTCGIYFAGTKADPK
jgi:hypothetical protein